LVIEVTVVAITAGFGAPRATPVITVLGYRVVNYRLPLLPGALAYLRLRLSLNMADKAKPPGPPLDDPKLGAICLLAADVSQGQRSRFY